jgi:MFS family permease
MLRLAASTRSEHHPAVYYGWVMLTAVALAQVTSWGILYYGFSVFIAPIHEARGWSIPQMTGAYSLALLLSAVAGVPVGRWLDRHGPRALMTIGSLSAVLLVVAWSSVHSLLSFYLVWAGIGLTMSAVLYEPAFYVVATWFQRKRSRALTLLTFIGGFASVIYIPLASFLIDHYGWREALLILAALLAAGTLPIHALLLRRHPADLGLEVDGERVAETTAASRASQPSLTLHQTLRDASFWWLSGCMVLANFATMAMLVHLIPYLTQEGHSRSFAASAAGAIGLLGLPGRLIFTPLGSRIPRRIVTSLIFALQTTSLVVLLLVHGTLGVACFVVLFGAGFGAITPARAALVAENYGPAHYGSINGVLALCITGARSAAPVGAGLLYAGLGGYRPVFLILLVVSLLASLAALRSSPARTSLNVEVPA